MNAAEAVMSVKSQLSGTVRQKTVVILIQCKMDYVDEELIAGCVSVFKLKLKPVTLPLLQWPR